MVHTDDVAAELRELVAEVGVCIIQATEDFESCGHCSRCREIDGLVKFASRSLIALLKNDRSPSCPTCTGDLRSKVSKEQK